MESFPSQPNQPGWQDITIDAIEEKIEDGDLKNALFLCNMRKQALLGVVKDTEKVIQEQSEEDSVGERQVSIAQWEKEKQLIQEEIDTLETYITQIQEKLDQEI